MSSSQPRPRPRPYSPWHDSWWVCLAVASTFFSSGLIVLVTGLFAGSDRGTKVGMIFMSGGVPWLAIFVIMYSTISSQQPISGRVIDGYFTVSGFAAGDLPLGATLDDLLSGKLTAVQELQVTYWLHVAPLGNNQPNRWFRVTSEVFGAHPAGADYDAKNPAAVEIQTETGSESGATPIGK